MFGLNPIRHSSRADGFHSSLCVHFHMLHCVGSLLNCSCGSPHPSLAAASISAGCGAWCINSSKFSTEQTGSHAPKQQQNIQLIFIMKVRVGASKKIMKKSQMKACLLIFQLGTACVVVFTTQTCNCGHVWFCLAVSQLQLPGSAAPCCTQNAAGGGTVALTCNQWSSWVRAIGTPYHIFMRI